MAFQVSDFTPMGDFVLKFMFPLRFSIKSPLGVNLKTYTQAIFDL